MDFALFARAFNREKAADRKPSGQRYGCGPRYLLTGRPSR